MMKQFFKKETTNAGILKVPKLKTVGSNQKPKSFNDWSKYISKLNK